MEVYASRASERSDARKILKVISYRKDGVGSRREPQIWMKEGDIIEVEISGIGKLVNTIENEV